MSDRAGAITARVAVMAPTPTATLTPITPIGAGLGAAAGISHARLLGRCEVGKRPFPKGSGLLAFCASLRCSRLLLADLACPKRLLTLEACRLSPLGGGPSYFSLCRDREPRLPAAPLQ